MAPWVAVAHQLLGKHMRIWTRLISAGGAISTLVLVSCGSVFTTTWEQSGSAPISALGSYYFLPKTRIKIDGAPGKDSSGYTIAVSQVNEPDRDQRYFLHYHRNVF